MSSLLPFRLAPLRAHSTPSLPRKELERRAAFQGFADQTARRLILLDSTETLGDLAALPGNRLEALRGDRAGQRRIRINVQWRTCFRWTVEGLYDVEIVDDHGRGGRR